MPDILYAETVNYWKTGKSSPDTWTDRTRKQVENLGGTVLAEGYGSEPQTGRAAYMLGFEIGGERYKVVWPVLPSEGGDQRAAKVQAATIRCHDVKSRCIWSVVLGVRTAFFSFLMLPNGQTVADMSTPELGKMIPALVSAAPQLMGENNDS
jgi:hypothetical protein